MITLISIAVAMLAGLIVSRPARVLKLPAVTAYLVAGVLIGPFCLGNFGIEGLGFTSESEISALGVISNVALGFIAFAIGNEFRLSQLKATGKQATVIGIVQAVVATVVVDIALILFHLRAPDKLSLPVAITLGAIAAATAPAATLMVVRQYKAKGKLTDLLLPIVALDDAVGLVIFAISFGIARALQSGVVDMVTILAEPILEIVGSLMLGTLMGVLLTFAERFFHSRSKRMSLCIVFVFLTVGLSMMEFEIGGVHIGFSSLLVCMMLGTVFCNLCQTSEERTDGWTAPLFILFFVMSGAELDLAVFRDPVVVLIGVVFLLARAIGKWGGAYMSSSWVHCDDNIRKYLGVTLLPQAGVALGMSVTAMQLGADGALIRSIVLFSVLILELVGPMLTKIALKKAGDIREGATDARAVNELPHHKVAAK